MSVVDPGDLIDGRYRVLSRIGAGGMADVFLAEDEQLQRHVALKLLHQRFAEDPGFVERFRREAQSAASLQHPNVVSVFDRGAFHGTYYIAMEYLEGRSLKQLIREEAPLAPVRAIDLTVQILKAARFAHRRGVIHRDLKPHNVIVDESDHAKVTDFGIARAGASDMTETGSIMGTAQYLSPEQAQGHAVSEVSDLYSVGIVLYEMLTGRVPFDGESAVTIALKQVSEAPVAPRRINPGIPEPLEQVVLWALNKQPADRPQSAEQFISVLEQVREAIVSGSAAQATASMAALPAEVGARGPGRDAAVAGVAGLAAGGLAGAALAAEAPPGRRGMWGGAARRRGGGGTALVDPLLAGGIARGARAPARGGSAGAPPPGAGEWGAGRDPGDPERGDRRDRALWAALIVLLLLVIGGGVAAYLLTRPVMVSVPRVVGEPLGVAQAKIETSGLPAPSVYYTNSSAPADTVIHQSPLGGARVQKGLVVSLGVSQGPGQTSVPPVAGLSEAAARKAIRSAGLKVGHVLGESSGSVPKGEVVRSDPGAGQTVQRSSTVTLYVSTGRGAASVPPVQGDSLQAAISALRGAGFAANPEDRVSSSAPAGTVISQSPAAGVSATPGSTVTIVIATTPSTVSVPDVVGFTAAAARSDLSGEGFHVRTTMRRVRSQSQNGIVVAQSPSSGTNLHKGATVTIVVGHAVPNTPTTPTTNTGTTPTTTTSTTPTTPTTTTPGS